MAPSDFVSRGQALVASGQYQEAVKICRLGLLGRPTTVEGRVVLGQALLALRRYDEVLAEMRVALELENTSAAAYQLKGEALMRKGDAVAAIETLNRARQLAPGDPSIAALLAEAEIAREGSGPGVGGLGYVDLGDSMTKHYPSHQGDQSSGPPGTGSYTRPTSLQKPTTGSTPGVGSPSDFAEEVETRGATPSSAAKRSGARPAQRERDVTPPPEVLSIGDRSGTVEVDPDLDGVEMDDDFGEVAEPPPSIDEPLMPSPRGKRSERAGAPRRSPGATGTPRNKAPSRPAPAGPGAGHFLPAPSRSAQPMNRTSSIDIDDDDVIEVESGVSLIETPAPVDLAEIDRQARDRARRRSVGMPAGPLDDNRPPPPRISQAQLDAANRPTEIGGAVPSNLRPPTMAAPPNPLMPIAAANAPRPPMGVAALPTIAGRPLPPGGPPPARPGPNQQAGMPSMSLSAAQARSAQAVESLFPDDQVVVGQPMPSWAKATMIAPGAPGGIPARGAPGDGGGGRPMYPGGPGGPQMPPMGGPMQPAPMGGPMMPGHGPPMPPGHGPSMPPGHGPTMAMRGPAPPGAPTARPGPAVMPPDMDGNVGDFTGLLVQPASPGPGGDSVSVRREETGSARHHPTGVRPPRNLKILMWIALGAVVIGGGVFAGFQIRKIRLERQIDTATSAAEDAARPDTWLGWIKARDGFAGIVNARDTSAARAKVARARAVLAADFGDDMPGARQAVEALAGGGGKDGAIARAYLAIAGGDAAAAQSAAQAALDKAPDDPAAHAVVGRAAILGHRWSDAVKDLRQAIDKDARPAYLVSLAEAELGRRKLDEARVACERSLALVTDHPATLIVRARVMAAAGGKLADGTLGAEVTGQLEKVLAEGQRALPDQTVGVSPRQATDASLALVVVLLARKDAQGARLALDRALANRPLDQRFAEDVTTALIALGQLTQAQAEAKAALEKWPASVTARIGMAQTLLADGDGTGALEILVGAGNLDGEPLALALRGQARLAMNDLDGARADLDAALAIAPEQETAIVGRTWVDLRGTEAAQALARIEPLFAARGDDPVIATAYAAALRQTGTREKARAVLEKITASAEGAGASAAWLELGRLERDAGNYDAARKAYEKAIFGRGREAKLEAARLYIDDGDVKSGRDTLDELVKQAPNDGEILVETARARTLQGDLAGAREMLARAEKLTPAPAGLAREQGRLALKVSDFKAAVAAFEVAVKAPGTSDIDAIDAYLMLLDAIGALEQVEKTAELLESAKRQFGDKPERYLIMGKVALITGKTAEARGYFEDARKQLDKKAPSRRLAEALFGLGRCALINGDVGPAVADFRAGLKFDPTAVDVWAALGDLASDDGNLSAALVDYQNAAKYNPEYAEMAYQVGRTARALGKTQVAKEALERYLALAPNGELVTEAKKLLAQLK